MAQKKSSGKKSGGKKSKPGKKLKWYVVANTGTSYVLYRVDKKGKAEVVASAKDKEKIIGKATLLARRFQVPVIVAKVPRQTGSPKNYNLDRKRKALPPGKRISRSGKVYYEYRANRSDLPGRNV